MLDGLRRLLTLTGVATALVLGDPITGHADLGDPVTCLADPTNPACVVALTSSDGGTPAEGRGKPGCRDGHGRPVPCVIPGKGWWGGDGCYYRRADGHDLNLAELLGGAAPPGGHWYVGVCGDPVTDFWPPTLTRYTVYEQDPGVALVAREAVKRLPLPAPAIRTSPDVTGPFVVFVPTWLWVQPGTFTTRSATASLSGVSVTAAATPTAVTWTTGDGTSLTCGAGTAWTAGHDPTTESPDCGHTYTRPSRAEPGGTVTLRATITWEISWSGSGQTGTEPALTSTSAVPVRVAEASAINTR